MKDEGTRTEGFADSDEGICVTGGSHVFHVAKSTEAQIWANRSYAPAHLLEPICREANRPRSKPEFIAKIGDCLKELDETAYWLELLAESSIVPNVKLADLRGECDQLLAIFTTISKKAKAHAP